MNAYEESDEYCPHCDNHYVCFFFILGSSTGLSEGFKIGYRSKGASSTACRGRRGCSSGFSVR
jgi:hypothetical protein